jgi:periplasmic copper chaperone A
MTAGGPATFGARRAVVAVAVAGIALAGGLAGCGGSAGASASAGRSVAGTESAGTSAAGKASAAAGDGMPAAVPGTGRADAGDIHVRNAYIPQQASADVAAAYFSVTNDGRAPDRLTGVTSSAAKSVSLHTTVTKGDVSVMQEIPGLDVPAGGTALLSVAGRHLMLENPVRLLRKGDSVTLTLRFSSAGAISLTVPVVGYTGPTAMSSMPDMSN